MINPRLLIILSCLAALASSAHAAATAAPSPSTQPSLEYSIVVTGGELLAGAYPDGHTHFITRTLRLLGWQCAGSVIVDDHRDNIEAALRFAARTGRTGRKGEKTIPLIIVTGGLGPTDNDITRQTLQHFTGIPLEEHPDVLSDMERRFRTPRDQLRPNLRRQTQTPKSGTWLKNPNGTAVGLVFEFNNSVLVSLPGPPRELQPMVRDELVPYLTKRFGSRPPGCSLTLRFVGLGQSQISQTINDNLKLPDDVTQTSSFDGGRVDFAFWLPHDTQQNRSRLDDIKQKLLQRLPDNIYAADESTLEECVAKLLAARAAKLAIAEIDTGGALAAAFTQQAPTARAILAGACTAPTEEKLRQLLHIPDAQWNPATSANDRSTLLATALAAATHSDWSIVIGEPHRDPTSALSTPVIFRSPDGRINIQQLGLRPTGELARAGITTQILDQLRRKLR